MNQIWSSAHQGTVEASVCIMGDALHPTTWFSTRHLNICQKTLKETSIAISYVGARVLPITSPQGKMSPSLLRPFLPQKIVIFPEIDNAYYSKNTTKFQYAVCIQLAIIIYLFNFFIFFFLIALLICSNLESYG